MEGTVDAPPALVIQAPADYRAHAVGSAWVVAASQAFLGPGSELRAVAIALGVGIAKELVWDGWAGRGHSDLRWEGDFGADVVGVLMPLAPPVQTETFRFSFPLYAGWF